MPFNCLTVPQSCGRTMRWPGIASRRRSVPRGRQRCAVASARYVQATAQLHPCHASHAKRKRRDHSAGARQSWRAMIARDSAIPHSDGSGGPPPGHRQRSHCKGAGAKKDQSGPQFVTVALRLFLRVHSFVTFRRAALSYEQTRYESASDRRISIKNGKANLCRPIRRRQTLQILRSNPKFSKIIIFA